MYIARLVFMFDFQTFQGFFIIQLKCLFDYLFLISEKSPTQIYTYVKIDCRALFSKTISIEMDAEHAPIKTINSQSFF